jgi:cobalt-precorrin-5B (C1)-methyltransferase
MSCEDIQLRAYDLAERASNGLRRGFTTGTCATAATKAALHALLHQERLPQVPVSLPDGEHFLLVPIDAAGVDLPWGYASVRKDAGDDPDQTHRALIHVRVRPNTRGEIVFLRGPGVGLVTQPGLQIPVGEPAINPVPRAMIRRALSEVLEGDAPFFDGKDAPVGIPSGFDVEVGCENGEEIAKRTFNPRLGIEGGISILGTTGIVEPKSLASFKAAIEVYLRVALAENPDAIVLSPGNLGQRFARTALQLPIKQIVQMSNFAGFALDFLHGELERSGRSLRNLWVVGHPGKLCKLLCGAWDTHSQHSPSAVPAVQAMAASVAPALLPLCEGALSVEAIIDKTREHPAAPALWTALENALARSIHERVPSVHEVHALLFALDGRALASRENAHIEAR